MQQVHFAPIAPLHQVQCMLVQQQHTLGAAALAARLATPIIHFFKGQRILVRQGGRVTHVCSFYGTEDGCVLIFSLLMVDIPNMPHLLTRMMVISLTATTAESYKDSRACYKHPPGG